MFPIQTIVCQKQLLQGKSREWGLIGRSISIKQFCLKRSLSFFSFHLENPIAVDVCLKYCRSIFKFQKRCYFSQFLYLSCLLRKNDHRLSSLLLFYNFIILVDLLLLHTGGRWCIFWCKRLWLIRHPSSPIPDLPTDCLQFDKSRSKGSYD